MEFDKKAADARIYELDGVLQGRIRSRGLDVSTLPPSVTPTRCLGFACHSTKPRR